jgi:hypothetical protein
LICGTGHPAAVRSRSSKNVVFDSLTLRVATSLSQSSALQEKQVDH